MVEKLEQVTYAELDAEASLIPIGSEGLLAIETFQGSRTPSTYFNSSKDFIFLSVSFYFIPFFFFLLVFDTIQISYENNFKIHAYGNIYFYSFCTGK